MTKKTPADSRRPLVLRAALLAVLRDCRRALILCASVCALAATGAVAADQADDPAPNAAPATVPYVYSVENTGAEFPAPPLPALADCPAIAPFPDPFAWANDPTGKTRSTALGDWSHHRAEIIDQIEHYEIGVKPAVDVEKQVAASYAGDGTPGSRGTLSVTVTVGDQTLTLTSAVNIPANATAPYPVVIGMNSPTGALPANAFSSRGIATVTYTHNQVTSYGRKSNTDPFFKLYGPSGSTVNNTGQYAAWSWGVSRLIDGMSLVKDKIPLDMDHICVTGCSYAGKMALFAGALDERIALTVAQESGGGGAPAWRYSQTERVRVENLGSTDHSWFASQMFQFAGNNVSKLPVDHNLLCALVAPRALYVTGNTDFEWLSNASCYVSSKAVAKTYETLGVADRFGYCVNGRHGHCQLPASQGPELTYFLDKFMKGQTELSETIATIPDSYSTIDADRWTQWWGTGDPVLPPAKQ